MLKSIGFAAAAVLAAVSFVQPPTASAQDRYSNRWNGSNYASTQNPGDYDTHGSDQNRGGDREYNSGYSAPQDRGDSGSYGSGRQNVSKNYRQPASQLRYGGPSNNWSNEEGGRQSSRNVRDWDDHR